jgi:hypothetical protein
MIPGSTRVDPARLDPQTTSRARLKAVSDLGSLGTVDGKRAQVIDTEAWPKATSQGAMIEHDFQRP